MDKIKFACSGCGRGMIASADKAGTTGKCPSCGVALTIPNTPGRQDQPRSSNVAQHAPQATTTTTAGGGDGEGGGTPTTTEGGNAWILQLKTIGNVLKLGYLYLYCPLRRKRETLPQESWLLMALLPPAAACLVALVLCLLARGTAGGILVGAAVVVALSAGVYALLAAQASVFGPSAHDAEAALAPIMARLRGLRQTTRTLREAARSVRRASATAPPPLPSPAPYHAPGLAETVTPAPPSIEHPSDTIDFACSGCGKGISAPADKAGGTTKCAACGVALQIPQTRDYYKRSLVAAMDGLLKTIELRRQGEDQQALRCLAAAEQAAREVLASPCLAWLPPGYEVSALNVLGSCGWHLMDDRYDPSALNVLGDCRERSDKFAEAQAALEKALTLGRSKGYTAQESGIADILCKIYGLAILRAASGDHLDEAAAIASKLDDLVRCYKEVEGFQSQEHGSALLMANATIDAMNAEQQCDYEKALDLYDRLLESPYIKCSESGTTLRWLVGTAYMRIGRILFLYQSHVADAIPYLQNAVQYCVPEDKQLHEARSLLKDAMSQA